MDKTKDTDWIPFEINDCIKFRKKNGYVTIAAASGAGGVAIPAYPNNFVLGILPEECRPTIEIIGIGSRRSNEGYECQVGIKTNGAVTVINLHSKPTVYWAFNITFPC